MLDKHLRMNFSPLAEEKSIIKGEGFRLTVLTPCVLRAEVQSENIFTDEPTQIVFFRNTGAVDFSVTEKDGGLLIKTEKAEFFFDKAGKKVSYVVPFGKKERVSCSNKGNLKGTARTLDMCFGPIPLKNGIMSKTGVSVIDDSTSLLFDENGEIIPRKVKAKDIYVFAHGSDYLGALKDFYQITGNVPLIPRYALGNWWSRYRAYTQQEYMDVMLDFEEKQVPLSVATIDMDWHWVDVNEKFNTSYKKTKNLTPYIGGWTGYSWNTDLFPDYKGFLNWLHEKNLKTTLNLHPADGIRWFEDMYEDMCKELGIEPKDKGQVAFDITDPKFINAYFKILHKPYENDGVDFWWIDWQQGKKTKIPGLDPLYALNHFHYLDNAVNHEEPLLLSRYAGLGSHRYPLGFSGDSAMNWAILRFIPYFTVNAANAGYTWWSHDIGGHHMGVKDDELYMRWIQFGVFNPIVRLHSTSHDLLGKEPWRSDSVTERCTIEYLRLRKKLVPYIYTMNYLTHTDARPLCMPMYYAEPEKAEAYTAKNEYYFGTELIVAPITSKMDRRLKMGRVKVYLPEGRWTDIFTSRVYEGGRTLWMYRDFASIPVLAKEGAIIPLDADDVSNGTDLPVDMEVSVYRGNNSFRLVERDEQGKFAYTGLTVEEQGDTVRFTVLSPEGEGLVPENRSWKVHFKDLIGGYVELYINGEKTHICELKKGQPVNIPHLKTGSVAVLQISAAKVLKNQGKKDEIINILSKMQGNVVNKRRIYAKLKNLVNDEKEFVARAYKLKGVGKYVREAFKE